jgi:hypothetical protein
MRSGPRRGGEKYEVQVSADGAEWHAVTMPVHSRNTALALAEQLGQPAEHTFLYRAFNRYTRRETKRVHV